MAETNRSENEDQSKRLNKFISDTGFCSRREADEHIEAGHVTVNGKVAQKGSRLNPGDKVHVNGREIVEYIEKIYIAFNKPSGVTCTTDTKDPTNIIDYIGFRERIFPIGRIDKNSEGLIFLTNDGDIVNQILRAGNNHEKEYMVVVNRPITEQFLRKMAAGVKIHHTTTLPCKVTRIRGNSFKIILTQGLNQQIRLMCDALGYQVVSLTRTRIMDVDVKGIETGTWRHLTKAEVADIMQAIKDSSKTEEASKLQGRHSAKKMQNKSNPSVTFLKKQNRLAGKEAKKKSPIRNKMKSKKK